MFFVGVIKTILKIFILFLNSAFVIDEGKKGLSLIKVMKEEIVELKKATNEG